MDKIQYRFIESALRFRFLSQNTCCLPLVTERILCFWSHEADAKLEGILTRRGAEADWMVFLRVCEMQTSAGLRGLSKAGHGAQLGPRLGLGRLRINTPSFAGFWQEPQSRQLTDHGDSFHVHAEINLFVSYTHFNSMFKFNHHYTDWFIVNDNEWWNQVTWHTTQ